MVHSMSTTPLWETMVTIGTSNRAVINTVTENPMEEYLEVKAATWIDRVYIPIIFGVGMFGNILCFTTLVFTSLRNTSTCIYMAVIAVLDCVILTHAFCVMISRYTGDTVFFQHIDWLCGLQHFLFYFAIHYDVLVLLAVTVDRYIVVRFPLKAQSMCTPKSAIKVIVGLGVFIFTLNFQIFFNKRLVPSGPLGEGPLICWYPKGDIENFMSKIYTFIDAMIYSFIPFVALTTLNLLIIRQLNQSQKFSKQFTYRQDADTSTNTKNKSSDVATSDKGSKKPKANTNITLMLLLVSFGFLTLTSPMVIVLLYMRYTERPKTNLGLAQARLTLTMVEISMYSNHAVNFLLYSISGQRFRQELKQLLGKICRFT